MKLYILRPIEDSVEYGRFTYDCAFGFVVRAKSPKQARTLAALHAGCEGIMSMMITMVVSIAIIPGWILKPQRVKS